MRHIDWSTYRHAAAMIERDLRRTRTAKHLGAAAALRVLSGHADTAVALLQEAVALAPSDARLWSDLAAARLLTSLKPASALDMIDTTVLCASHLASVWHGSTSP